MPTPAIPCSNANHLPLFVRAMGQKRWNARLEAIRAGCLPGHAGRALRTHHALELTLDRLWRTGAPAVTRAERTLLELAGDLVALLPALPPAGRERLRAVIEAALTGPGTLVSLFHLLRCARLHRQRGFDVAFSGLAEDSAYDLTLCRAGRAYEAVCETFSAEDGRDVSRTAWSYLVDRVDPDLQSWLATHPAAMC